MTCKENDLVTRTTVILGKNTQKMKLVEVIEELVKLIEDSNVMVQ
jgi:hypothetical protein